jgi:UDP-N-acetylglucosamine--N-acetylmuramyl-(pentapeptide) pyrophosphoryl-undecaprenol N-acetylglucosamine transferase
MESKPTQSRILLVGGGTGGHFYPLVAIAEELRVIQPEVELYYAGPEPYDSEALSTLNIAFIHIGGGKMRRYQSILNVFDILKTIYACSVALLKLFIVYPDVIMSKGGYTSVPIVLAGYLLRIPIVIHESDARMGRANAFAAPYAQYILTSYTALKTVHPDKTVCVGIPIRRALLEKKINTTSVFHDLPKDTPKLLVLGGSQGALRINNLVLDSLDELLPRYTIIHQTGATHYETCKSTAENLIPPDLLNTHYRIYGFMKSHELQEAYEAADIVISRGGSTSLYEIALHGKPSIVIPIPEDVSHDQRTNAYAYSDTGAATVIEEHNLTTSLLQNEIERIMQNTDLRDTMKEKARAFGKADAGMHVATLLIQISKEHES